MSSADAQDMTARKSVIRRATAPDLPGRVLAEKVVAGPAEIWLEEGEFG